jgi:deazaflavin-dependent oxidoreductase (nitroreductase family)
MAIDPELAQRSVCYLETTGRMSGVPRDVEIWFAADPDRKRIYLLSGGRDRAHWVRNIRREPAVRVTIGLRRFAGRAVEIDGGADAALARRLLAAKYQGWVDGTELSGWAQSSLPVAIDLFDAPAGQGGDESSS